MIVTLGFGILCPGLGRGGGVLLQIFQVHGAAGARFLVVESHVLANLPVLGREEKKKKGDSGRKREREREPSLFVWNFFFFLYIAGFSTLLPTLDFQSLL